MAFFLKKNILELRNLEFFNETKIPELRNSGIKVLLSKGKTAELRSLEILFSLKFRGTKS